MATLDSIKAQIAKLTKQAQAIESKAVQKVLALMSKLGVSVDDLPRGKGRKAGGSGSRGRSTVGAAKYRDPATGKTWTGHGRAPDWIKSAANRDDYLISGAGSNGSAASAAAPAKAAKKARKAPAKKATKRATKAAAKKTR